MTIQEVLTELRSQPKIYYDAGITQPYFSQMIAKIASGQCKPGTVARFLAKFGYHITQEAQWGKK